MTRIPLSFRLPLCLVPLLSLGLGIPCQAQPGEGDTSDAQRLVAALLGETPMVEDLRRLTDEVGGRPTGSAANERAVEWALARFREIGVKTWKERFEMPEFWLEQESTAVVTGDGVRFAPRIVAAPFSTATPAGGLEAPLVDGGHGTEEDFARLGESARGAFVLIETDALTDVPGLFKEYGDHAVIEPRAFAAGVAGVVYQGSRPRGVLHRHNAALGTDNTTPILALERTGADRAFRLLRHGKALALTAKVALQTGGAFPSDNVFAEIPGSEKPEEIVLIGAHLDSWGLGTGALDNGSNVCMLIDLARQITRLGLKPRRTIRFALWNGEEQGMVGSWKYTQAHADEMSNHVLAQSYDIGTGRIVGYFTNGRGAELAPILATALTPVTGLGPFTFPDEPVVGTDNFDFMMHGVANLVALQESANYGPHYHADTDTFEQVDQHQLRLNAAIAAAVTYGFAQADIPYGQQTAAQVRELVESTTLGEQMKTFLGIFDLWAKGERGLGADRP